MTHRSRVAAAVALAGALAGGAAAPAARAQAVPELKTDEQKTLYAVGLAVAGSLGPFALSAADLELVKAGITDGVLNRQRQVDLQAYGPKIQELQRARASVVAAAEQKTGQAIVDKAAAEKGATKTASGLVIVPIKPGSGASPKATDKVKVHYHGTLADGAVFDSSVQRNEPATFPLNGVIPCWTEGLQLMKVGGKSRLVCPAALAYGNRGAPPRIKPGATLTFEVELIEIVK
ncbi:MAG TPA: FKBP-type peptidyl-prolyl cis-trans isomerase [Methylomirabilota bacterium]|jgi:FKBP-type peptidyl-prolyl cis-trans isomerase FkpA/FKBP-type peptidyl-prolyl cis-trans isomerase FklB|nr:FKBP-type peptidyl-prolyl cis-trans isomerase [Methylomirabilota bacterium]